MGNNSSKGERQDQSQWEVGAYLPNEKGDAIPTLPPQR